jgi:hypothetical protein
MLFCVSFWFFFLRFSTSWVTSLLIFSICILIHLSLYIYCSLFHFGVYLGVLWVHLFVSVSSCILYFWCFEFSWVHLVHFGLLPLAISIKFSVITCKISSLRIFSWARGGGKWGAWMGEAVRVCCFLWSLCVFWCISVVLVEGVLSGVWGCVKLVY